ncbi:ASCH domain-containing protein [Luteococcus sp. OSA5]|uniref:ASCH domain-containing protein n=1 Tax=Luteococcus sp. OSA5 TaxID=3401630 RepID=UPI003B428C40
MVAVVAVYGRTGQVIAPCGKCRQVLHDLDPTIQCVVRGSNGLEAMTVSELLPHAYDWRSAEQAQRIYMWEGYEPSIRSGAKRQTIRIDDPFHEGAATIVFEKDSGDVVTMAAKVTSVTAVRRCDLTEEHARNDGFSSLAELQDALDTHYPGLGGDDPTDVVTFELQ